MFFKRARQRPRCDMRGAACNHLNQCTYTLYHSIIIYTRCTARTVSRRYFIRKDSQRLFVFPDIPIDLVSLPRSFESSIRFQMHRCSFNSRCDVNPTCMHVVYGVEEIFLSSVSFMFLSSVYFIF